jgi:ribonucleoside-diphosphate reductase alpha chain
VQCRVYARRVYVGRTIMVIPVKLPRPKVLVGITVKVATGCGNMYVQMNWHQGHVFEVFATLGHSGNCASSYSEGLTRCVTLGLRSGIPHEEFFKELRGIRCPTPML